MAKIIDILLATYNGEAYLALQLDSILRQTVEQWRLIARDDGSTDQTLSILKSYKKKYPQKIQLIQDNKKNLGALGNFAELLTYATADYIMFCDQDDIWKPGKIEKTMAKMLEVEKSYPGKPVLIFTDLELVDEKGKLIHESMWDYQKVDPAKARDPYYLAILNPVTGCTIMLNKIAKEAALPISKEACMHDWWLALNVAKKGIIDFVDTPTILYRQHGSNVTTTSRASFFYFVKKLSSLKSVFYNNYKVYIMLKALDFNISYCRVLVYKIKFLLKRMFGY